jgi:4-amino-4-deoxy-L-arabinose transferase-like glycosyltransferase
MNTLFVFIGVVYFLLCFLYAWNEGRKKKTGFIGSLLLVFLLPFAGFWVVEIVSRKKAKGCEWCGNKYNEAEYCGLCGKNEAGEIRKGFIPVNKK